MATNCNPNCPCGSQPGTCVFYTGAETTHLHILTNTNLNEVVRILDAAVEGIVPVETALTKTITINSLDGISLTGANTQTIGSNPTYSIGVVPSYIRTVISGQFPIAYNSATGVISSTLTQYTNEMAQDTVAAMIAAGTHVGISFSYVDSANSLSAVVSQTYIRNSIGARNGLTYNPITGIVELGTVLSNVGVDTIIHDTYLDTDAFLFNITGNRIYEYGFLVSTRHEWGAGTGLIAFRGRNRLSEAENTVRLGIDFMEGMYLTDAENADGGDIPGYFGFENSGYSLGTNMTGHGSFGQYVDDFDSKASGIFFHTKDTGTKAVTIYGVPGASYTPGAPPVLGIGLMANYKIFTAHTDKDLTFHGYPSTRDNGSSSKHLYTDIDGIVKLGDVAIRAYTPSSSADAAGSTGDITYSNTFLYVKTAAGWARTALATF